MQISSLNRNSILARGRKILFNDRSLLEESELGCMHSCQSGFARIQISKDGAMKGRFRRIFACVFHPDSGTVYLDKGKEVVS